MERIEKEKSDILGSLRNSLKTSEIEENMKKRDLIQVKFQENHEKMKQLQNIKDQIKIMEEKLKQDQI